MLDASPTKFGMRRVPITDHWTEPDLDVFPLENPPGYHNLNQGCLNLFRSVPLLLLNSDPVSSFTKCEFEYH